LRSRPTPPSFEELLPNIKRAHDAARLVIPKTGCQLASALLTLDLGRSGCPADYVTGRYSGNPGQDHWWVEVSGLLLDPTRDQFGEDPFSEDYQGKYVRSETPAKPANQMATEAARNLQLQWNAKARQAITQVAQDYGLDMEQIEEPLHLALAVTEAPPKI
jgi:hypothetical protein